MTRQIEVVAYDPAWPGLFRQEADLLATLFGAEVAAIYHIGSTSVPGLSAKPIIDILFVVHDIERVDDYNGRMRALGYEPRGEYGLPRRRFFPKTTGGVRRLHVHTWQVGDPAVERHLAFRDYLRVHPEAAQAYGVLKQRLALEVDGDSERYTHGKHDFVSEMEQRALAWRTQSSI